jgi:hypothetical protein
LHLKFVKNGEQAGKLAAETTARYFAGKDAPGFCVASVYKLIALVVENDRAAQAALLKQIRGSQDQAGLSGAKKAAYEYDPRPLAGGFFAHPFTVILI